MTLLNWENGKHLLGIEEMDETHREFAEIVNRLAAITEDVEAFQQLFHELGEHTKCQFENEERLMEESSFPAISEHRSEHARILGQFAQIDRMVQKGRIGFGRAFVEDLPQWFDLHAATMDSALAGHLKNQGH